METSAADRVEPAASICKHILTFFARRLPPGRLPRSLFSYNERALVRRRGGNLAARGSAPGPRPSGGGTGCLVPSPKRFAFPFLLSFSFLVSLFLSSSFFFLPFSPPSFPQAFFVRTAGPLCGKQHHSHRSAQLARAPSIELTPCAFF